MLALNEPSLQAKIDFIISKIETLPIIMRNAFEESKKCPPFIQQIQIHLLWLCVQPAYASIPLMIPSNYNCIEPYAAIVIPTNGVLPLRLVQLVEAAGVRCVPLKVDSSKEQILNVISNTHCLIWFDSTAQVPQRLWQPLIQIIEETKPFVIWVGRSASHKLKEKQAQNEMQTVEGLKVSQQYSVPNSIGKMSVKSTNSASYVSVYIQDRHLTQTVGLKQRLELVLGEGVPVIHELNHIYESLKPLSLLQAESISDLETFGAYRMQSQFYVYAAKIVSSSEYFWWHDLNAPQSQTSLHLVHRMMAAFLNEVRVQTKKVLPLKEICKYPLNMVEEREPFYSFQ